MISDIPSYYRDKKDELLDNKDNELLDDTCISHIACSMNVKSIIVTW